MRVPAFCRPMVFGFSFVVCQMLVSSAQAWDWNPFNSNNQSANDMPNGDLRAGSVGMSGEQRWMDRSAVEQASAQNPAGRGTVMQAVWGDKSQEAAIAAQKKAAAAAAAKRRAAANAQSQGNAPPALPQTSPASGGTPTYHGSKVKVPQMPFARSSSAAKDMPQSRPRTTVPNAAAAANGQQAAQALARQNAGQNRNSKGIATRPFKNVTSAARPNSANTASGARPNNSQPKFQPPSVAPKPEVIDEPTEAASNAPSDGPTLTSADGPELADAPIAAAQTPKTAADRLILEAHELSAQAQTEEDYTRVVETCRHTLASQPTTPVAHYANELASWALNRRGQMKAETGRTKEAALDFDDAIRLNAECWRAIHNRGVLQAEAGNFERAFDDFNRTVQLKPDFAKAFSNRAALFVIAGDIRPALQDYSKAIEIDPSLAVAQRGYGRVCHLMGRLDESIIHYDAAVRLAPQDAYAVASRADVLTDLGRYADAIADYDHAIQLDSRSANAYRGSAWLLATCPDSSIRDAALAVERAELAIQYDEKADSISFDTLAAAQASAGDFRTAVQTIRRAIEIAPNNERDVYQNRLVLYQRAKPYRIAPIRQQVTQASFEQ